LQRRRVVRPSVALGAEIACIQHAAIGREAGGEAVLRGEQAEQREGQGEARASGGQRPSGLWNGSLAGGWIDGLRSQTHDLAAGAGEAQNHAGSHEAAGARDVDCLRRKEESRYQLADVDPAASMSAIPKGASPLAAGGLRACMDRPGVTSPSVNQSESA